MTKSFDLSRGEKYHVLKGIDLHMKRGEFYALMGPSGSGKSTALNIIGGLVDASGGRVIVNGNELSTLNDNELTDVRRHAVGWVFQDFNLISNLTALENVLIPMNLAGNIGPAAEEKAISLLRRVGLEDRMHHFPDGLSGGQQQRVAIARALANDPVLLLADEPTGNLDSHTGLEVIELFKELASNGMTILMVSHDVALAHASQRVYILRDGKVEEEQEQEVI
ncbi:MAG: ABC transporter ATP-binding protein [Candidatus Heimdallarchaeota archaeon]|nr:ABC transporter ATP-binding protein [Candidatus Heimdallarchaeota archaeon]